MLLYAAAGLLQCLSVMKRMAKRQLVYGSRFAFCAWWGSCSYYNNAMVGWTGTLCSLHVIEGQMVVPHSALGTDRIVPATRGSGDKSSSVLSAEPLNWGAPWAFRCGVSPDMIKNPRGRGNRMCVSSI